MSVLGSPLAVALGHLGCGEIIQGSTERSRHQTHREEWITPTGGDSNKLKGGVGEERTVSGLDKSPGKGAGLLVGIKRGRRRGSASR